MDVVVLVLICFAILCIAFFAGIEVAFATANRLSIELKKQQGSPSGILLSKLSDEPSRFLGTVMIGFNIAIVSFVLLVSTFWQMWLNEWEVTSSLIVPLRVFLEIVLSMLVVVILGQFIPKAVFKAKSDRLMYFFAKTGVLGFFYDIFYPVASVFIRISQWILTIIFDMRIDKKREPFSRSDLENFFQQTREFHEDNQDMNTDLFEAALSLPKVKVRQCLVPRKEIEAIELNSTIEMVRNRFVETRLSKIVVYEGNIDHIVGYVHQLDLFRAPAELKEVLLPIPAIPESMSATDLITKLSTERKSIAWVVDEFGGTSGIVTMEDMLEEIFGEIHDEFDEEEFEEKKISDTEFILSGRLELDYLIQKYGLEFSGNVSETLSGFIIHEHEAIPKAKDRIFVDDYEFEIIHVSDTRIDLVRLKILK